MKGKSTVREKMAVSTAQLGWQICHRDTDMQPPGHPSYAVYSFDYVMTWVANADDRFAWRLCPILEGDIDKVDARTKLSSADALKNVKQYNLVELDMTAKVSTILAALRWYQKEGMGDAAERPAEINDIATDGGSLVPLDSNGIDALCERLNGGDLSLVVQRREAP
jgi:hypothetical protein